MDDMNAFERQVAGVVRQTMRPPRDFDAMAIVDTARAPVGRFSIITRRRWGGMTPAPREGGFSMFSAVKLVAATAIVALMGGLIAVGLLPADETRDVVPAAPASSGWPDSSAQAVIEAGQDQMAVVHIEVAAPTTGLSKYDPGIVTYGEGVSFNGGAAWQLEITDTDDPRLDGTLRYASNQVDFLDDPPFPHLFSASTRIDTAEGSWIGVGHGFWSQVGERVLVRQDLLHGTGAYEGLSLLLFSPEWGEMTGIIFPGGMLDAPEVPEPAPSD